MLFVQNCRPAASGSRFRKSRYCCVTKIAVLSIGFGKGDPPALIVICGAVLASRLLNPFAAITMGRSPVSTVEGKTKVTKSVPGKSDAVLVLPAITVVPIVAVIMLARFLRTPVNETRKTVAT